MPSNTTYKPQSVNEFEAGKLNYNGQHVSATVLAGSTQNLDLLMVDDHIITGVWLLINGGNFGDGIKLQIIDSSGAFTGVPGTVLNQFIDWLAPANTTMQFDVPYPAKIYAGLTIRAIYSSTGLTPVEVAVNYKLHKVLV